MPRSGKNENFFKVREKSGTFLKSQEKSLILSVSEKSGNSVFRFIVHKFKILKCIFFRKSMLQSKQSDQFHATHDTCRLLVVVSGFRCEYFLALSAERGRRENNRWPAK